MADPMIQQIQEEEEAAISSHVGGILYRIHRWERRRRGGKRKAESQPEPAAFPELDLDGHSKKGVLPSLSSADSLPSAAPALGFVVDLPKHSEAASISNVMEVDEDPEAEAAQIKADLEDALAQIRDLEDDDALKSFIHVVAGNVPAQLCPSSVALAVDQLPPQCRDTVTYSIVCSLRCHRPVCPRRIGHQSSKIYSVVARSLSGIQLCEAMQYCGPCIGSLLDDAVRDCFQEFGGDRVDLARMRTAVCNKMTAADRPVHAYLVDAAIRHSGWLKIERRLVSRIPLERSQNDDFMDVDTDDEKELQLASQEIVGVPTSEQLNQVAEYISGDFVVSLLPFLPIAHLGRISLVCKQARRMVEARSIGSPVPYQGSMRRKVDLLRPLPESFFNLPGYFDIVVRISSTFDGVSCRQLTWMLPPSFVSRVLSVSLAVDPVDPPPALLSTLGHGLLAPFASSPCLSNINIFGASFYDFGDLIPVKRSLKELLISDSSTVDLASVQQGPYVTTPHTMENLLRSFSGLRSLTLRRCHEDSWRELTANAHLLAVEELKVMYKKFDGSVKLQFSLASKAPETLKSLSLIGAGVTRLSSLKLMRKLEYLNLENLQIEDPYELRNFLMCCPALKHCRLKNAFAKTADITAKAAAIEYVRIFFGQRR